MGVDPNGDAGIGGLAILRGPSASYVDGVFDGGVGLGFDFQQVLGLPQSTMTALFYI